MSYSRYSGPFDQAGSYLRRSQIPATIAIIAVSAVLFLLSFFIRAIVPLFTFFVPPFSALDIFTIFAYPLVTPNFISVVFACLWLVLVGGSLERSWGSGKFLAFFFALTAITGLGLLLGSKVEHTAAEIVGMWVPVTSLTVAWATINPTQTIMLYGIVPVQARWIAIFEVGVIYFINYSGDPILGLFALLGPLAAFVIVRLGFMSGGAYYRSSGPDLRIISGGRPNGRPLDDAGITFSLNPINRYRAWQQRRKLAKLLQKSGFSDRDNDRRSR